MPTIFSPAIVGADRKRPRDEFDGATRLASCRLSRDLLSIGLDFQVNERRDLWSDL